MADIASLLAAAAAAQAAQQQAEAAVLVEIGARVKALRESRGWLQKDLARHSSLSTASICRIEQGRQDIYVTAVLRIALALGASLSDLVGMQAERAKAGGKSC